MRDTWNVVNAVGETLLAGAVFDANLQDVSIAQQALDSSNADIPEPFYLVDAHKLRRHCGLFVTARICD